MHFLYKILVPKITKPNITREKLLNLISYKKCKRKMLVKLTPDPQKDTENLTVFLALSGSESVKATCRMLMKLTLDREQGSISSMFYEKILGT